MRHERLARRLAASADQVEDTGGQIRLRNQFRERRCAERRFLRRLDDDRIAGDKRGGDLSRDHEEREIPRQYARDNAKRATEKQQGFAGESSEERRVGKECGSTWSCRG